MADERDPGLDIDVILAQHGVKKIENIKVPRATDEELLETIGGNDTDRDLIPPTPPFSPE